MINNRWFSFKNITISNHGEYVLAGVSNLETGSASKNEINYINTDGAEYQDITYNPRMFEISGFIDACDTLAMVLSKRKLIQACSLKTPFRLQYCNREEMYSAECYFDKLPTFEKRIGWRLPFKLYLVIPGFWWQSGFEKKFSIYSYHDEVIDTFTLPAVFTSFINQADVYNNGDSEAYPIFTVKYENPNESKIMIKNTTSGKQINLNYSLSLGEVVTIDCYNKIATSSINGNVTGSTVLGSDFFLLEKGVNHIECESEGNIVDVRFYENYLGV